MSDSSKAVRERLARIVLFLTFAGLPVLAQDDQPDPTPDPTPAPEAAPSPQEMTEEPKPTASTEAADRLRFRVEVSNWAALPAGLEFEPVQVVNPFDPFGTTTHDLAIDNTESSARYGFAVEFPQGHGGIQGTWWTTNSEIEGSEASPGEFVFGELLAYPLLAGFNNDGLADGYTAQASTLLRELRIDYFRTAFQSSGVSGRWFVGYRSVTHDRRMSAEYFALEPLFPPLLPPRPDLDPASDTAAISSQFEGRGVEGGLFLTVPILSRDRLSFEGGITVAAMRGDVRTEYRSVNAFYVLTEPGPGGQRIVLSPPYDNFQELLNPEPPEVPPTITQEFVGAGVRTDNRSASGSVIEAEFGARWRFWRTFALFGGYRSARYDGVGVDIRPGPPTGTNVQTLQEDGRSVYYEGFFFGLSLGF